MNTIQNFSSLPKNEQVYTLFHEGKEVLDRRDGEFVIKLFSVQELYVEVWYNSSRNIIEQIQVISEEDLVRIYDKEINLSQLIKK